MTVLTLREAFVESAPRHYDRVPGAGLKGGDASRRKTAGSRQVGGVRDAPRPSGRGLVRSAGWRLEKNATAGARTSAPSTKLARVRLSARHPLVSPKRDSAKADWGSETGGTEIINPGRNRSRERTPLLVILRRAERDRRTSCYRRSV
jgi:hypothetical protein